MVYSACFAVVEQPEPALAVFAALAAVPQPALADFAAVPQPEPAFA